MNKILFLVFAVGSLVMFYYLNDFITKDANHIEQIEHLLKPIKQEIQKQDSIYLICNNEASGLNWKVQFILAPTRLIFARQTPKVKSGLLLIVSDKTSTIETFDNFPLPSTQLNYQKEDSIFSVQLYNIKP